VAAVPQQPRREHGGSTLCLARGGCDALCLLEFLLVLDDGLRRRQEWFTLFRPWQMQLGENLLLGRVPPLLLTAEVDRGRICVVLIWAPCFPESRSFQGRAKGGVHDWGLADGLDLRICIRALTSRPDRRPLAMSDLPGRYVSGQSLEQNFAAFQASRVETGQRFILAVSRPPPWTKLWC